MTRPPGYSIRAVKSMWCLVALGLTLAGCTPETIGPSDADRAARQQSLEKGVDQSASTKTGKKLGPPIVPKSIKSRIKKEVLP